MLRKESLFRNFVDFLSLEYCPWPGTHMQEEPQKDSLPYPFQSQRLRLDLVFPHQICSVPAHIQKVKKYQKNRGEFIFHF